MEEIYKDIQGCEGLYQVSNMGNVKTLRWGKERLLTQGDDTNGYLQVSVNNKKRKVHKLVAMAFLGHTPNGFETVVHHIDGNKKNNNVDNLELVTSRYNSTEHIKDVGVTFDKKCGKWKARIRIGDKRITLGLFTDKQDALDAYQNKLKEL